LSDILLLMDKIGDILSNLSDTSLLMDKSRNIRSILSDTLLLMDEFRNIRSILSDTLLLMDSILISSYILSIISNFIAQCITFPKKFVHEQSVHPFQNELYPL